MKKIAKLLLVGGVAALLIFQGIFIERCGMAPFSVGAESTVKNFHRLMYAKGSKVDLFWLGIRTEQNPNDVWIAQEIISETKPDLIIETGTMEGGSAVIWAMIQREVNPGGKVITIDIQDRRSAEHIPHDLRQRIEFVVGNSVDPMIVSKVAAEAQDKTVMILLDSNHTKDHVLKELLAYSPLVSVGSYAIVQDTDIGGHPIYIPGFIGNSPMEAIEQFLRSNSSFQIDESREKLLYTQHPHGYLRRVK